MNVAKPPGAGGPELAEASPGGKAGGTNPAGPERKFADVLSGKNDPSQQSAQQINSFNVPILDDPSRVQGIGKGPEAISFQRSNRVNASSRSLEVMGEKVGRSQGTGAVGNDGPMSFQKMADSTFKAETRIDSLIKQAQSGKSFNAQELMGLQIEVFRYSQTVEVISRTTDKLVGAVKQTLQTQV